MFGPWAVGFMGARRLSGGPVASVFGLFEVVVYDIVSNLGANVSSYSARAMRPRQRQLGTVLLLPSTHRRTGADQTESGADGRQQP